jgi:LAS superfamily LD-carboxypeptidase LdcB
MIYAVEVTKTWNLYVQANSRDEAEEFARQSCEPDWEDHAIGTDVEISSEELNVVNVTWLDHNFNPVD